MTIQFTGNFSGAPVVANADIRIGTADGNGVGTYDSNDPGCGPVIPNGTYSLGSGSCTVTSGVVVFNGAQTTGDHTIGGAVPRTVNCSSTYRAVASDGEWDNLSAVDLSDKTVVVRFGSAIDSGSHISDDWVTVSGDGTVDFDMTAYHMTRVQFGGVSQLTLHNLGTQSVEIDSGDGTAFMDNLFVDGCLFETDKPNVTGGDPGGSYFTGMKDPFYIIGGNTKYVRGLTVRDCKFRGSGQNNGIGSMFKFSEYAIIVGNVFTDIYGDGFRMRGLGSFDPMVIVGGNVVVRPWGVSTDSAAPHTDGFQEENRMNGIGQTYEANGYHSDGVISRGSFSAMNYSESTSGEKGITRGVAMISHELYGMRGLNSSGGDFSYLGCIPALSYTGTLQYPDYGSGQVSNGNRITLGGTGTMTKCFGNLTPGGLSVTDNATAETFSQAQLQTALPSLFAAFSAIPTHAEIFARFAPAAGQALDGYGPGALVTPGVSKQSEYTLAASVVPNPSLTSMSATKSGSNANASVVTDVAKGFIKWVIVPSATTLTTADFMDILTERVSGALEYGETTQSTATTHSFNGAATLSAGDYMVYALHMNGFSRMGIAGAAVTI